MNRVDHSTVLSLLRDWRAQASLIKPNLLLSTVVCILPCVYFLRRIFTRRTSRERGISDADGIDALSTDPGLLHRHFTVKAYYVPATGVTYPGVRTFFRPHPQGDKLPNLPKPIPLLVFIHGLGGSIAQFHPLLISLVNTAPCLAIDLPGCGLSEFEPRNWDAFSIDALVRLLEVVIEQYRDEDSDQDVVLICHSMGCSLGALLSSTLREPQSALKSKHILGMAAICPVAEPPSAKQVSTFRKLLSIPGPIFDIWRAWDRCGGPDSASVYRFVGHDADLNTRELQVRFNEQSRTPVWRRMAWGTLPDYSNGTANGGLPGEQVWASLKMPIYLVAGAADRITPASNVQQIARFLGYAAMAEDLSLSTSNAGPQHFQSNQITSDPQSKRFSRTSDYGSNLKTSDIDANLSPAAILKITVFPAPSSHAIPYHSRTARPLAEFIQGFLGTDVDHRLSLGWQLQHLSTEGK